jgi:hypothetical protein
VGDEPALIWSKRDAADSSSGVRPLLLLLLEMFTIEAVATGPRFNIGGTWDVRTGSTWVEEGGEGKYEPMRGDDDGLFGGRS